MGGLTRGRGTEGFTLLEVVLAAALLSVFGVFALEPLGRSIQAGTMLADRAFATNYAVAGLEWLKGSVALQSDPVTWLAGKSDTNLGAGSPSPIDSTQASSWTDSKRNIKFERTVFKTAVNATVNGSTVRIGWNLRSRVRWTRGSHTVTDNRVKVVMVKTFVADKMLGK